jgi:foldase protein PrsA
MSQNKGFKWKMVLVAMTAIMAFSVLAACGKKDNVVATYDGGEVTADQFDLQMRIMLVQQPAYESVKDNDNFRDNLLKQMIAFMYLEQHADEATKKEAKATVDKQFDEVKKSTDNYANFKKSLEAQKVTEDEFISFFVRANVALKTQLNKVTDDEVKVQFEAEKEKYTKATVRHILLGLKDAEGKEIRTSEESLKLAKELEARLAKGEDFAKLANEYSTDPGSNKEGGLYENVDVNGWVPEFKEAALTQPIGKVGEPVETQFGYHIILVEKRTEKKLEELTQEEKEVLKTELASKKLDDFMAGELTTKIIKKIDLPKVETKKDEKDGNKATDKKDQNSTNSKDTKTNTDANKTNSDKTNSDKTNSGK